MKRDCTICVAKTKALISCAVTTQLICGFALAYAKSRFSHNKAPIKTWCWYSIELSRYMSLVQDLSLHVRGRDHLFISLQNQSE